MRRKPGMPPRCYSVDARDASTAARITQHSAVAR
jgi:hypothetical protein